MIREIKKLSLTEQAYELIKGDILSFRLEQGEKLVIDKICREFKLSNTPVREAIRKLQQEGYVVQKTNAGFFVKKMELSELIDIANFIKIMMTGSVDQLIQSDRLADVLPLLEERLKYQEECLENNNKILFEKAAMSFDRAFMDVMDNKNLSMINDTIFELFSVAVHKYMDLDSQANRERSIYEHNEMIQFVKDNDGEALLADIRRHYDQAVESLKCSVGSDSNIN